MESLNKRISEINKDIDAKIAVLNEEREKMITEAKAEAFISKVDELPTFNLMTIFENASPYIIKKGKEGKKLINKYIQTIKGDKALNETYFLRENVLKIGTMAPERVNENVDAALRFAKGMNEAILGSDSKALKTVVKESLSCMKAQDVIDVFNIDDATTKLNECVDYLVQNERSGKNFLEYDERLEMLKESLSKREAEVVAESKKDVFEKEKESCIQAIDEAWQKADTNLRMKLTEIKDRLTRKEYSEVTADDDIKYISELKSTIS